METIKKIKVCNIWPGTKNGYEVEITEVEVGSKYIAMIPKEEYELRMQYIKLAKLLNKKDLDELKKVIEDYGDLKYEEASDSAAQAAAGAAI